MSDTHVTPVIFRTWPKSEGGGVIALFPADPADTHGSNIWSFEHVGQHGGASPDLVHRTKPATPEEYADLKAELEAAPYGYRLKVYRRITAGHRKAFTAEQRRSRPAT